MVGVVISKKSFENSKSTSFKMISLTFESTFLYIRITFLLKISFLKKISFHFESVFLYINETFLLKNSF